MKILYKNSRFSGGSSKSLLEYAKLAQRNGNSVISAGEYQYDSVVYNKEGIKTFNIPYFRHDKPIYNLLLMFKYIDFLKKEKPDLIQVTTTFEIIYQKVISDSMNIPVIYTIAGGTVPKIIPYILKKEEVIVFSKENKIDLINYGYKSSLIEVIPNRINYGEYKNSDNFEIYSNNNTCIKLLLISRISKGKFNSIKNIIDITQKLYHDGFEVNLTILGDGKLFDKLEKIVRKINNKYKKNIINLEGYQSEVLDYIKKNHIIFAKGRGALESLFSSRITFIVSEEDSISLCNKENISNLMKYNLSGRNIENETNYKELTILINKIKKSNLDLKNYKRTKEEIIKNYDINKVQNKILNKYKEKIKENNNINSGIIVYIKMMMNYLILYVNLIKFYITNNF